MNAVAPPPLDALAQQVLPFVADPLEDVLATGDDQLIAAMANRCREMWSTALHLYVEDAGRAAAGARGFRYREALDDLLGDQIILARLCEYVGLDPEAVGWRLLEALTRPGGDGRVGL